MQKYRLVIWVFILLCAPLFIKAQVLKISTQDAQDYFYLPNYPYFNEVFIQRNKIRKISINHSYKPDGKVIVDHKNEEFYYFDSLGVLIAQEQVVQIPFSQTLDTTRIEFTYNTKGQKIQAKKTNRNTHSIHTYFYQNDTLYKHQYHTSSNEDEKTLLIYEESFENKKIKDGFERITKNDGGKAYKSEQYLFLEAGTLQSYSDVLIFNGNGRRDEYTYDPLRRIEKKEVFTLPDQKLMESTRYVYDNINLMEEIKTEVGTIVYRKEFIYKENLLLNTILIRDERIQSIKILKFSYHFW